MNVLLHSLTGPRLVAVIDRPGEVVLLDGYRAFVRSNEVVDGPGEAMRVYREVEVGNVLEAEKAK